MGKATGESTTASGEEATMTDTKAIVHGTVIDGTGAEPIEDGTVIIQEGRIAEVGRSAEIEVPSEAQVIEAAGKTVMPGMMEAHAHVGGDHRAQRVLRLSLQRGITTVCSVSAGASGCALRDAIESGEVRGCARLIAGCVVCCTNGHVRGRDADGPWEVRKGVREMVEAGADFIKTCASGGFWAEDERCSMRNYTPEELEALADEAHAWDRPVVVHAHTQPGINNAIAAGIDQIHHGAFIDEEGVAGIAEKGLYYVPTLRVTCTKNIQAHSSRPWMIEEMTQSQPIHRAGVRKAKELGVKIAVGTDYPSAPSAWRIGDATPWEWIELVEAGLTPMETLVAGTRNVAEAYGKLDELGTLEAGKRADVIVVEGNPLEDVGCLYEPDNILVVLKDGRVESTREDYKEHYRVREEL